MLLSRISVMLCSVPDQLKARRKAQKKRRLEKVQAGLSKDWAKAGFEKAKRLFGVR